MHTKGLGEGTARAHTGGGGVGEGEIGYGKLRRKKPPNFAIVFQTSALHLDLIGIALGMHTVPHALAKSVDTDVRQSSGTMAQSPTSIKYAKVLISAPCLCSSAMLLSCHHGGVPCHQSPMVFNKSNLLNLLSRGGGGWYSTNAPNFSGPKLCPAKVCTNPILPPGRAVRTSCNGSPFEP